MRPDLARICSLVIDREPTSLRQLEDILGFTVPRDRTKPWKARVKNPRPDIDHVYAAFLGPTVEAIASDPDPLIDDLGVGAQDIDCVELATALLGPSHRQDRMHRWRRGDGELAIRDGYLSWVRSELPGTRTDADTAALVAGIAALLERDITFDAIAQVFGPVRVEGRTDARTVRRPTWWLGVPLAQKEPYNVMLGFDPPLPCEPLFAALGWHDVVIDHDQQRQVSALDGESRWYPLADSGFLVHVSIHEPAGIVLGSPYAAVARQRTLATHWIYLTRSMHHRQVTP